MSPVPFAARLVAMSDVSARPIAPKAAVPTTSATWSWKPIRRRS